MRFSSLALALLPISAIAQSDADIMTMTPTIEELQSFYPDTAFLDSNDTSMSFHELSVDQAQQRNLGYKFVAAGLTAIGYYSLAGGCDQVDKALSACSDDSSTGAQCVNRIAGASVAHILVAGAGFVGGRQFIMYFWHGGALQAAGLPTNNNKAIRACNTNQRSYSSSAHFSGQYGLKIAGKDMSCYSPDSGQLGYASSLGSMIASGLNKQGQCALSTQFTVYKTSTNQVLGRYHLELDSVRTDVCPFGISGSDSCSA